MDPATVGIAEVYDGYEKAKAAEHGQVDSRKHC